MIKQLAVMANPLLDNAFVRRTRRNHGLEHATVHILGQKIKGKPIAGRSDGDGFWLIGDVETTSVEAAVNEALRRMRSGEHSLAIHPGCGTARLTTATVAGLAAMGGSAGVKRGVLGYLERIPLIIILTMVAILWSEPLGLQLQEHFTTLGDPGDLEVLRIERREANLGGMAVHRIITRSS